MANKVALIILDGFGISSEEKGNAILNAKIPFIESLFSSYPKALLRASAEQVGLPWGEFGNSEVGHTGIGMGRVVLQDLPQIDRAFKDGSISNKPIIKQAMEMFNSESNLHLLGLASDGAVHGHIVHLINLAKVFLRSNPKKKVILHLILDGRDVQEKSAQRYLEKIESELSGLYEIGSIMGRYFAMDRDKNWDRIQKAYDAIVGLNFKQTTALEYLKSTYNENKTDEFVEPISLSQTKIDFKKDILIFTNFRSDRAIELTRAFTDESLSEIKKVSTCNNFLSMTTYDDNLNAQSVFSNLDLNNPQTNSLCNPLPKIISENKLSQFHIAETEKFAHVTYFFAGGERESLLGQEDKLLDSEKVKSYDLFPQMRAPEISDELIKCRSKGYNFIIANYANADMVGHSGKLEPTIKTVEILDQSLEKIVPALLESNYEIFITSDHGNCDEMIDFKSGQPNKEHTLNPVPFLYINPNNKGNFTDLKSLSQTEPIGILADIAPTVLHSLGLEMSEEMTGANLKESLI